MLLNDCASRLHPSFKVWSNSILHKFKKLHSTEVAVPLHVNALHVTSAVRQAATMAKLPQSCTSGQRKTVRHAAVKHGVGQKNGSVGPYRRTVALKAVAVAEVCQHQMASLQAGSKGACIPGRAVLGNAGLAVHVQGEGGLM